MARIRTNGKPPVVKPPGTPPLLPSGLANGATSAAASAAAAAAAAAAAVAAATAATPKDHSLTNMIHKAVLQRNHKLLKAMLNIPKTDVACWGADRSAATAVPNSRFRLVGETAVHLAVALEDIESLKLLLDVTIGVPRHSQQPCRVVLNGEADARRSPVSEMGVGGVTPLLLLVMLPILKTADPATAVVHRLEMLHLILTHDVKCDNGAAPPAIYGADCNVVDLASLVWHFEPKTLPILHALSKKFRQSFRAGGGTDAAAVARVAKCRLVTYLAPDLPKRLAPSPWLSLARRTPHHVQLFSTLAIIMTAYKDTREILEDDCAWVTKEYRFVTCPARGLEGPLPLWPWLDAVPRMKPLHFCVLHAALADGCSGSDLQALQQASRIAAKTPPNERSCGVTALYLARAIPAANAHRKAWLQMLLERESIADAASAYLSLPSELKLLASPDDEALWFGADRAPSSFLHSNSLDLLSACCVEAMPGDRWVVEQLLEQPYYAAGDGINAVSPCWAAILECPEEARTAAPISFLAKRCAAWGTDDLLPDLEAVGRLLLAHPRISLDVDAGMPTFVLMLRMEHRVRTHPAVRGALCLLRLFLSADVVRRPTFPNHIPGLTPTNPTLLMMAFQRQSALALRHLLEHCVKHSTYGINYLAAVCMAGWQEGVDEVLQMVSDASKNAADVPPDACTALHWICRANSTWHQPLQDLYALLVGKRSIPFPVQDNLIVRILRDPRVDVNARDADGRTPLFYAHTPGALGALLEHKGLEVNARDGTAPFKSGSTAVMFRINVSSQRGGAYGMSLLDQVRHIVSHPHYDHTFADGYMGGNRKKPRTCVRVAIEKKAVDLALVCHAAKELRRLCPELTTAQMQAGIKAFEVLAVKPHIQRMDTIKATMILTARLDAMPPGARADLFSSFQQFNQKCSINSKAWELDSPQCFLKLAANSPGMRRWTEGGDFMDRVRSRFGEKAYATLMEYGKDEWEEMWASIDEGASLAKYIEQECGVVVALSDEEEEEDGLEETPEGYKCRGCLAGTCGGAAKGHSPSGPAPASAPAPAPAPAAAPKPAAAAAPKPAAAAAPKPAAAAAPKPAAAAAPKPAAAAAPKPAAAASKPAAAAAPEPAAAATPKPAPYVSPPLQTIRHVYTPDYADEADDDDDDDMPSLYENETEDDSFGDDDDEDDDEDDDDEEDDDEGYHTDDGGDDGAARQASTKAPFGMRAGFFNAAGVRAKAAAGAATAPDAAAPPQPVTTTLETSYFNPRLRPWINAVAAAKPPAGPHTPDAFLRLLATYVPNGVSLEASVQKAARRVLSLVDSGVDVRRYGLRSATATFQGFAFLARTGRSLADRPELDLAKQLWLKGHLLMQDGHDAVAAAIKKSERSQKGAARNSKAGKHGDWKSKCLGIVATIEQLRESRPFQLPMDPDDEEYHEEIVVKNGSVPMDLTTLRINLVGGQYRSLEAFSQDMDTIWRNNRLWNREGFDVRKGGELCQAVWEEFRAAELATQPTNTYVQLANSAPFQGSTLWDAAWAWFYLGCWAAVDVLEHGRDKDVDKANEFFHRMLCGMAQASLFAGRAHLEQERASTDAAAAEAHLNAAKREFLCCLTDATAALSRPVNKSKEALKLVDDARSCILDTLEELRALEVPHIDSEAEQRLKDSWFIRLASLR